MEIWSSWKCQKVWATLWDKPTQEDRRHIKTPVMSKAKRMYVRLFTNILVKVKKKMLQTPHSYFLRYFWKLFFVQVHLFLTQTKHTANWKNTRLPSLPLSQTLSLTSNIIVWNYSPGTVLSQHGLL